jgi:Uncharacterized protein predicted to be involved in DNA repair (RAMP superfamily)
LAYCDEIIDQFVEKADLFGKAVNKDSFLNEIKDTTKKELYPVEKKSMFTQLCSDDDLPIIARNVLENGESKNLWYEQVIPAETIFYTFIQSPSGVLENELDDKIVQIGANATIGYGYCKFTKLLKS